MTITQRTTPNKGTGRSGWVPDMIVCHITDGSYEGSVSWLANKDSGASTHFVVAKDGRITQLVPIADTAWANGTNNTSGDNRNNAYSTLQTVRDRKVNANLYTVSIEHEGKSAETQGALTATQLEATVWLMAHIRAEVKRLFGKEIPITRQNIVAHSEVLPKWKPNCPGPKYPFDEIIKRLNAGTAPGAVPETPPSTAPQTPPVMPGHEPSKWALDAWNWARSLGITDGTNPQGAITREQVITMLYNSVVLATK